MTLLPPVMVDIPAVTLHITILFDDPQPGAVVLGCQAQADVIAAAGFPYHDDPADKEFLLFTDWDDQLGPGPGTDISPTVTDDAHTVTGCLMLAPAVPGWQGA